MDKEEKQLTDAQIQLLKIIVLGDKLGFPSMSPVIKGEELVGLYLNGDKEHLIVEVLAKELIFHYFDKYGIEKEETITFANGHTAYCEEGIKLAQEWLARCKGKEAEKLIILPGGANE